MAMIWEGDEPIRSSGGSSGGSSIKVDTSLTKKVDKLQTQVESLTEQVGDLTTQLEIERDIKSADTLNISDIKAVVLDAIYESDAKKALAQDEINKRKKESERKRQRDFRSAIMADMGI